MNIDEVYRFTQFLSNKSQQGNVTPANFNLAAKNAQNEWIMKRYNNPAEYRHGLPVPRVAYQQNQKISDDLRPFITAPQDYTLNDEGQLTYPSDYLHADSFRYYHSKLSPDGTTTIGTPREVSVVRNSELGSYLSSNIRYPRKEYPIVCFYDTYMQFYPTDLDTVTFNYLRKATDPKWAYTLVNNRPVYDGDNSVDLEAPEEAHNEIVAMICSYIGINLKSSELIQYSEMAKKQGI